MTLHVMLFASGIVFVHRHQVVVVRPIVDAAVAAPAVGENRERALEVLAKGKEADYHSG